MRYGLGYSLENSGIFQSILLFSKSSGPTMEPTQPPLRWIQAVKEPGHEAELAVRYIASGAIPPLPVRLHVAHRGNFSIQTHMTSSFISDGQYHRFILLVPISSNKSRRRDGIIHNNLCAIVCTPPVRGLMFGCMLCFTNMHILVHFKVPS